MQLLASASMEDRSYNRMKGFGCSKKAKKPILFNRMILFLTQYGYSAPTLSDQLLHLW